MNIYLLKIVNPLFLNHHERFFYLDNNKRIEDCLAKMDKMGLTYWKDGALWFKTTDYGDDKDRVLKKHGNGPQVGMINLAMEYSSNNGGKTPAMPFPECGAMSQGYIGYHLQQAIQNELLARKMKTECATVVTQVVVKEDDPGFKKPTKPVGSFYSQEEANRIAAEKGYTFVEDAGRGYRRVVPSPIPCFLLLKRNGGRKKLFYGVY